MKRTEKAPQLLFEINLCVLLDAHFSFLLMCPFSFLLKISKSIASRSRKLILPLKGLEKWWGYHSAFWISSCILWLKKTLFAKIKKKKTLRSSLQDTAFMVLTLTGGCDKYCSQSNHWRSGRAVCSEKGIWQKHDGRQEATLNPCRSLCSLLGSADNNCHATVQCATGV